VSGVRAPLEGGGFIKAKDHLGHLVFFTEVHGVERRYDTKRKAEGDVLTLDWTCFMCHGGPNAELQERAMISAPYIVNKIHRDNPSLTLGYIVQLDPKPGFEDGAIVLNAPNDVDVQRAEQWWASHKPSNVQGPAGNGQAPSQADAWGTAPASAAPAPAQSPGAGWGNLPPQQPAAPQPGAWGQQNATAAPPAQSPPIGQPTGLDAATLQAMPYPAVQALVAQGLVTREQAAAAGHQV
jgi:hypothetical protein